METEVEEVYKLNPTNKLRLGIASWDDGSKTAKSIKFVWYDKNGKVSRGGEFPVEALPQAFDFATREGYITTVKKEA